MSQNGENMVSEIIKLIENGKIDEVFKKVEKIRGDLQLEIIALTLIEKSYCDEAVKVTEKISNPDLKDEILRKVIIAYIENGKINRASSLVDKIKTETDLEKIAMKLIEMKKYRETLKVAEKIKSRAIKEEILIAIINALLNDLEK